MTEHDLEQQIQDIRRRQEQAQKVKARSEAQREVAKENIISIVQRLREEFGVSSLEEAQALQQQMEESLSKEIDEITRQLEVFE